MIIRRERVEVSEDLVWFDRMKEIESVHDD